MGTPGGILVYVVGRVRVAAGVNGWACESFEHDHAGRRDGHEHRLAVPWLDGRGQAALVRIGRIQASERVPGLVQLVVDGDPRGA